MKLFEELTQLHGVSGYETAVADYIKEKLAPLADDITTCLLYTSPSPRDTR